MDISYATPTTLDSPEQVVLAEELGYTRAWFYDTPQRSPGRLGDCWRSQPSAPSGSGLARVCWCRHCAIRWSTPRLRRHLKPWRPAEWRWLSGRGSPVAARWASPARSNGRIWRGISTAYQGPPARRHRGLGGSPDADASPDRSCRSSAGRGARADRSPGAEGSRPWRWACRRSVHGGGGARLRQGVLLGAAPLLGHGSRGRRGTDLGSGPRSRRSRDCGRAPRRL